MKIASDVSKKAKEGKGKVRLTYQLQRIGRLIYKSTPTLLLGNTILPSFFSTNAKSTEYFRLSQLISQIANE